MKIRGQWRQVVCANARSVTVRTGHSWNGRAPWAEVNDHRAGNQEQSCQDAVAPAAAPGTGAGARADAVGAEVAASVHLARGAAMWTITEITDDLITLEITFKRNGWAHTSVPTRDAGRLRPAQPTS